MSHSSPSSQIVPTQPNPKPNQNQSTTHKKSNQQHQHETTTTTNNLIKKKVLGTTILPVTRVTRSAKQDKEIKIVSKEAIFLISIATEFFIRKLTDSAFEESKKEKRVFVKYNDIASAVQNNPEYGWLEQVIPPSRSLSKILNDPMIPTASTAITNQLPISNTKPKTNSSTSNLIVPLQNKVDQLEEEGEGEEELVGVGESIEEDQIDEDLDLDLDELKGEKTNDVDVEE